MRACPPIMAEALVIDDILDNSKERSRFDNSGETESTVNNKNESPNVNEAHDLQMIQL